MMQDKKNKGKFILRVAGKRAQYFQESGIARAMTEQWAGPAELKEDNYG